MILTAEMILHDSSNVTNIVDEIHLSILKDIDKWPCSLKGFAWIFLSCNNKLIL